MTRVKAIIDVIVVSSETAVASSIEAFAETCDEIHVLVKYGNDDRRIAFLMQCEHVVVLATAAA